MRRFTVVSSVLIVFGCLHASASLAWCIDNSTPFELLVSGTHERTFQTRLRSGEVFCAAKGDPRFQNMSGYYHGKPAITFYFAYQESGENAQKNHDILKALANLGKRTLLRAPFPVAVAPGIPMSPVCTVQTPVTDTLVITARPGNPSPYDKLVGTTPIPKWQCTVHPGDGFSEAPPPPPPSNIAQCRVQYHSCAEAARNCNSGNCPTDYDCQNEHNACVARVTGNPEEQAATPGKRWAAVAVDGVAQKSVQSGFGSEDEAHAAALDSCQQRYSDDPGSCRIDYTISYETERCIAEAAQNNGNHASYYADGDSRSAAETWADRNCRNESGDSCEVDWSYCTDTGGGWKPSTHLYGAIALPHTPGGHAVMVRDSAFYDASPADAENKCRAENHVGSCTTIMQFATCAAYVLSHDGGRYYAERNEDLQTAENTAMDDCRQHERDVCTLALSGCVEKRQ